MNIIKAIKLAYECIDAESRRLAVNANLYRRFGMESGRSAYERRERLRQAKATLAGIRQLTFEDVADNGRKWHVDTKAKTGDGGAIV